MSNSAENLGMFNVKIQSVNGLEVDCNTDDLEKTLLEYKPFIIKGKTVIVVEKGDKKVEKLLFVPQARRLFYNNFALKIFARNIQRALL